jgi:hypothetical protein
LNRADAMLRDLGDEVCALAVRLPFAGFEATVRNA